MMSWMNKGQVKRRILLTLGFGVGHQVNIGDLYLMGTIGKGELGKCVRLTWRIKIFR